MNDMTPAPQHFRSTKSYFNFPCAHRQHRHDGNCALVHGYARSFHFVFAAKQLDPCGFVVDFGKLKWVKGWLDYWFDHTLLLPSDDPLLPQFQELEKAGAATLRILPYGVGMEGTAQWVCENIDSDLRTQTKGRCWVERVEVREHDQNSAFYINPLGEGDWL